MNYSTRMEGVNLTIDKHILWCTIGGMIEGNGTPNVSIPDIYFDGIRVTVTAVGVNFTLSLNNPHPDMNVKGSGESHLASKPILVARTSLEHAKILVMLLKKQLKLYESRTGIEIKFPQEIYKGLGLDEKEWE